MTQDLIPTEEQTIDGRAQLTVRATDLHSHLWTPTKFADWFQRRVKKYGFVDGVDYRVFPNSEKNHTGIGRPSVDYILSLDMAKELAMVENTDSGRKVRRYFIECERRLLERQPAAQQQLAVDTPQTQVVQFDQKTVIGAMINGAKHALRGMLSDVKEHILTAFDRQRQDLRDGFKEARDEHSYLATEVRSARHDVKRLHSDVLMLSEQVMQPGKQANALVFSASGMIEIGGVYKLAGVTEKIVRRSLLSRNVWQSLTAFCFKHGYQPRAADVGDKEVTYWPDVAVRVWLDERGRKMINEHIARYDAAPMLRLVSRQGE
jgi:phage anti-repressor protein